ncbi:hypothetical protein BD560DRAFT_429207 [Blakeslea trispora]|nr:hypothetical protein BD560DRAFT_429207 [Blakeslea trispora]
MTEGKAASIVLTIFNLILKSVDNLQKQYWYDYTSNSSMESIFWIKGIIATSESASSLTITVYQKSKVVDDASLQKKANLVATKARELYEQVYDESKRYDLMAALVNAYNYNRNVVIDLMSGYNHIYMYEVDEKQLYTGNLLDDPKE